MEIKKLFGTVLRELRLEKGLTQEKLAELSNLDETFISMLENGKRQPTLTTIFSLSAALNIKASSFVERVEEMRTL